MSLSKEQLETLARIVDATRDDEIDCDTCLRDLGQYAEVTLAGRALDEALGRVRAHLAFCPECEEEFALLEALMDESGD
ncbi:MAG: hypothetical protein AAGC67_02175 [Myxococcota bacterium]